MNYAINYIIINLFTELLPDTSIDLFPNHLLFYLFQDPEPDMTRIMVLAVFAHSSYAAALPFSDGANYIYKWAVQDDYTNNNYGQDEKRDGYATSGSYYVALPDGRLQRVTYSVNGDGGYVAEVSYEGEAQYPEQKAYAPSPAYKPAPSYTY